MKCFCGALFGWGGGGVLTFNWHHPTWLTAIRAHILLSAGFCHTVSEHRWPSCTVRGWSWMFNGSYGSCTCGRVSVWMRSNREGSLCHFGCVHLSNTAPSAPETGTRKTCLCSMLFFLYWTFFFFFFSLTLLQHPPLLSASKSWLLSLALSLLPPLSLSLFLSLCDLTQGQAADGGMRRRRNKNTHSE